MRNGLKAKINKPIVIVAAFVLLLNMIECGSLFSAAFFSPARLPSPIECLFYFTLAIVLIWICCSAGKAITYVSVNERFSSVVDKSVECLVNLSTISNSASERRAIEISRQFRNKNTVVKLKNLKSFSFISWHKQVAADYHYHYHLTRVDLSGLISPARYATISTWSPPDHKPKIGRQRSCWNAKSIFPFTLRRSPIVAESLGLENPRKIHGSQQQAVFCHAILLRDPIDCLLAVVGCCCCMWCPTFIFQKLLSAIVETLPTTRAASIHSRMHFSFHFFFSQLLCLSDYSKSLSRTPSPCFTRACLPQVSSRRSRLRSSCTKHKRREKERERESLDC